MPKRPKTEAHRLRKKIKKLRAKLQTFQAKCEHPPEDRTYTRHWSTGHYDPTQDKCWAVYTCHRCLDRWHVDSQRGLVGTEKKVKRSNA